MIARVYIQRLVTHDVTLANCKYMQMLSLEYLSHNKFEFYADTTKYFVVTDDSKV